MQQGKLPGKTAGSVYGRSNSARVMSTSWRPAPVTASHADDGKANARAFPASALAHFLRRVLAAADPSRAADIAPLAADACERYHPQPSHRFRPLPKPAARKPSRKRTSAKSALASVDVTLEHVAKLAGVSRMTVSRALNHPNLLNKETLDRVREVIERSGYVPNMLAGGLASRRSRMVAAIVPSITNSIFVETIQALTDTLWDAGYQVMLGFSGYPSMREEALLAAVLSRRPDAIYLTGITHSVASRQRLVSSGIPVVETWDLTPTPIDMLVGFSHEKVGEAVAQYLLAKGYRRLALVTADDERAEVRRRGFEAALARERVRSLKVVSVAAPSSFALGREGLAQVLDGFDAEAVFCSSDVLAHGVLEEARDRKLAVPRDLAVVGFGGLGFTAHTVPPLSSVAVERVAIGREAARLILDRIERDAPPGGVIDVGFRIVERGTS